MGLPGVEIYLPLKIFLIYYVFTIVFNDPPPYGGCLKHSKSDNTRSSYLVYGYLVFFTNGPGPPPMFVRVFPPTPFSYRRLFTWWSETAMWAWAKPLPPPLHPSL